MQIIPCTTIHGASPVQLSPAQGCPFNAGAPALIWIMFVERLNNTLCREPSGARTLTANLQAMCSKYGDQTGGLVCASALTTRVFKGSAAVPRWSPQCKFPIGSPVQLSPQVTSETFPLGHQCIYPLRSPVQLSPWVPSAIIPLGPQCNYPL